MASQHSHPLSDISLMPRYHWISKTGFNPGVDRLQIEAVQPFCTQVFMCGDDVDMIHLQPAQDEPETSRTSKVPPIIDWNKGDWVSVRFKSWCLRSTN